MQGDVFRSQKAESIFAVNGMNHRTILRDLCVLRVKIFLRARTSPTPTRTLASPAAVLADPFPAKRRKCLPPPIAVFGLDANGCLASGGEQVRAPSKSRDPRP